MVNSQFIIYKWRLTDESDEWPMMKDSWSSLKICLDRNVTIEGNAARHLMLVASHAESPLGDSKWLERKNCGGESLPLGRRYGFSCPLPKGRAFRLRHSSSSHLPYLSERLYGWLLTSDAYRHLSVLHYYYSTSTTNTIFHFSIIHYELWIVNYKFQSSSPMKNRLT